MGQKEQYLLDLANQGFFYGFHSQVVLNKDALDELYRLLTTAIDTDVGKTEFPDFRCDGGWIEHFSITSGEIVKKNGYQNLQIENEQLKKTAAMLNNPGDISFASVSFPPGSHSHLKRSLRTSWDKHIESFKKSGIDRNAQIGIFLIDIDDRCIITHITDQDGGSHSSPYSIGLDIEILDFIYEYRDIVHYVIAYHQMSTWIEIISVSDIPRIKAKFSPDVIIKFDGVHSIQGHTVLCIAKKDKENS